VPTTHGVQLRAHAVLRTSIAQSSDCLRMSKELAVEFRHSLPASPLARFPTSRRHRHWHERM